MRSRSFAAVIVMGLALAACGSGGQSAADAQEEISSNWTTFFNGANPDTAGRVKLLQDGANLQAAIAAAQANPTSKAVSASVKKVDVLKGSDCQAASLSSPCAKVTYDIVANGSALISGSTGYAVRVNSKWVVSKTSFCSLLKLAAPTTPPGC